MIMFVAPYSPPNRTNNTHLGASRKIETIISILSQLDNQIVLINSAHNDNMPALISFRKSVVSGVDLIEVTPPISLNRTVGKLKNLFDVNLVLDFIEQFGRPQFIWFYNGYAFEMRFAAKAWGKLRVPMILEFEDWHSSRSRGLNPKPYVDFFLWRTAARFMSGVFAVNDELASKMRCFTNCVELLPGIVPRVLVEISQKTPPFSPNTDFVNVGFFGGLSTEKGADIVLQLARSLPVGFMMHVTGSGPLSALFESCAKEFPDRLCYYGRVDDVTLYQLIAKCDVVLNPHSSIKNMNGGVFPFKVIEAVASGRLLISTDVPVHGVEGALVGVQFVAHSVTAFYDAIVASHQYFLEHMSEISQGSLVAHQRFGEDFLLEKVQLILSRPSLSN